MSPLWFHSHLSAVSDFHLIFSASVSYHKLTNLEKPLCFCSFYLTVITIIADIIIDHLFIMPLPFSSRKLIMYEMHLSILGPFESLLHPQRAVNWQIT